MEDNVTGIFKTSTNGSTVAANGDNNNHKTKLIEAANLSKLIIPDSKINYNEKPNQTKQFKKKRRDKSDLGENFIAPDGGWGWLVAIASGVNIVSIIFKFKVNFYQNFIKFSLS